MASIVGGISMPSIIDSPLEIVGVAPAQTTRHGMDTRHETLHEAPLFPGNRKFGALCVHLFVSKVV